jgi:hypothetical protein
MNTELGPRLKYKFMQARRFVVEKLKAVKKDNTPPLSDEEKYKRKRLDASASLTAQPIMLGDRIMPCMINLMLEEKDRLDQLTPKQLHEEVVLWKNAKKIKELR